MLNSLTPASLQRRPEGYHVLPQHRAKRVGSGVPPGQAGKLQACRVGLAGLLLGGSVPPHHGAGEPWHRW